MAEIVHMEDLGFCSPGQDYKAVEEGWTRLDGPMPINATDRRWNGWKGRNKAGRSVSCFRI
ncbi:MAG: hypothetical protein ACQEUB_10310 [Thermodesulfobacteriota bacterium]